jgi:hypothetical protein
LDSTFDYFKKKKKKKQIGGSLGVSLSLVLPIFKNFAIIGPNTNFFSK